MKIKEEEQEEEKYFFFTWRTVVISWQLAQFGHCIHEYLGELQEVALNKASDNFQKLLHDNSNALITK